jgi:sec-independent protein translocase protein TatB
MIDFGFDKIALIGAVALIVIGPEKLPRVARTVGHLIGKAQRYVADVKAEVNRSIELEELNKVKSQFESAARDVSQSVEQEIHSASQALDHSWAQVSSTASSDAHEISASTSPHYQHPGKHWRLKRAAVPVWFKQRSGVRQHALSGAARVARFRPPGVGPRR